MIIQSIISGSGLSQIGTNRALDSQLASPLRSRVEIVARKSDHICVVRDVPEVRGSWFRGGSSASLGGGATGGSQQGSMDGSFEQASLPSSAAQMQAASKAAAIACQAGAQSRGTGHPSTGASAAGVPTSSSAAKQEQHPDLQSKGSGKASFAALFAKHPAIKEEPTTPGGSLLSETPPPSAAPSGGLGPTHARRTHLTPTSADAAGAAATSSATRDTGPEKKLEAELSLDQMNRIESLLGQMKLELKSEIAQLMTTTQDQNKQHHQQLQRAVIATSGAMAGPAFEPPPPPVDSAHLDGPPLSAEASLISLRPPGEFASDTPIKTRKSSERDRSKSPHSRHSRHTKTESPALMVAGPPPPTITSELSSSSSSKQQQKKHGHHHQHHQHHHHQHHHHQHHHKADHSTPLATPESSQLDLRMRSNQGTGSETTASVQPTTKLMSKTAELPSTSIAKTSSPSTSKSSKKTEIDSHLQQQQKQQRDQLVSRIHSLDQISDEDQDATSKL